MVDKLLQQKLNLVVLLDAGEKMNSPVPGKFPPIAHLKMATHAVKRLVKELAFVDRVSSSNSSRVIIQLFRYSVLLYQ